MGKLRKVTIIMENAYMVYYQKVQTKSYNTLKTIKIKKYYYSYDNKYNIIKYYRELLMIMIESISIHTQCVLIDVLKKALTDKLMLTKSKVRKLS